jgi:hypothetical protein
MTDLIPVRNFRLTYEVERASQIVMSAIGGSGRIPDLKWSAQNIAKSSCKAMPDEPR